MKIQLLVLQVFILVLSCSVSAQKLYVSPNGSDLNSGAYENPLATLNAACLKARELKDNKTPVEIIVGEGSYSMLSPLILTHEDSRPGSSPLIIRAAEGSKAIFRGGVELTGWEVVDNKLWRCFVPQVAWYDSYFEQLYVNGRRATRARTPDEGFFKVQKVEETIIEKGTGRAPQLAVQKVFTDSGDMKVFKSFSPEDFNDALIVFYHNWDNTRKRVQSISMSQPAFFISGGGMKPWNPINNKSRWFIENCRSALDSPGEWFLERSGYLYYIPLPGENSQNTVFYAPVIRNFIQISGDSPGKMVENISFENLSFSVAGYKTPPDGNEPAQAAAPVESVIQLDYAGGIEFINCEISNTGTYGIWFRRGCAGCIVDHCYLHGLGAGGIKIGETNLREDVNDLTRNITVNNSIITDGGHIFPCAVGIIIFHASDNIITHNEISNLRYSGISVGWVWGYAFSPSKRNKIEYNHIHHLGWGELCDMGGVYTLGASEGTTVSNNVVHHIYSYDYGGWGLYTDEGSYGIIMENNLVYSCKNSGFHQHYGKENIIRNNIFAFNIRSQLQATRIEEHRSLSFTNNIVYFDRGTLLSSNWHKFNVLSNYNCYWDMRGNPLMFGDKTTAQWQKEGKDINSVFADPQFTDADNFDFRLRRTTVARKIDFKPFDYSLAGVYGISDWTDKARFDTVLVRKFDEIVNLREQSR
jgi:parallel beta-helix repeat protein